jgi:hypothetical protein
MSDKTAQLLEAFAELPDDEKRASTVEFLRRSLPFDSGPLEDEETAQAGDYMCALLDREGNDASAR